jgi:hypothetical protein
MDVMMGKKCHAVGERPCDVAAHFPRGFVCISWGGLEGGAEEFGDIQDQILDEVSVVLAQWTQ